MFSKAIRNNVGHINCMYICGFKNQGKA